MPPSRHWFSDHAAEYAAKYASPDYFRKLIVRGLTLSGATIGQDAHILDLGAGAGDNSVFPCLDLLKQAEIVATDLSPKLLALLRHKLGQRGVGDSVAVVCTDAMLDIFVPGSFNLVIGRIAAEIEMWAKVIRAANIKPQ